MNGCRRWLRRAHIAGLTRIGRQPCRWSKFFQRNRHPGSFLAQCQLDKLNDALQVEYPGVHQIVVDAISRTDLDLRKSLYSNIVLSGGSTLTKGFGDRLLTELQRLAVKDMRIKIFAPPERKYSTWIGGSILAGLSTFRKVRDTWVSWCCRPY